MRKTPPMEIVNRMIMADALRELGPEIVQVYNPNLIVSFTEEDEEGNEKEVIQFDWEYIIFNSPIFQLELVFQKMEEEAKKNVSSILDVNGQPYKNPVLKLKKDAN